MHNRNWWTIINRWGPVIALMALLFYASDQPHYAPPPDATDVYMSGSMPILIDYSLNTLVKKSAHVITYGLLAGLIMRALVAHKIQPREAGILALVLALSYAITDEIHQAFVFGRHSSVIDIGFDYIGASAITLIGRWYYTASARESAHESGPAQETCLTG